MALYKQNKMKFNFLGYALTFIGYMTLTLSLPLVHAIVSTLHASVSTIHYGISILFFTFSISAVLLSSLSDMLSAFVVLKYAQLLSIIGLILLALCHSQTIFLIGCTCLGCGTGCYASSGRALISRHAISEKGLKQAFAYISIFIVIAPFVSFVLALAMLKINWHLAYASMAVLESILAVYAYYVLKQEDSSYKHGKWSKLFPGYFYCLRQRSFLVNMISLGILLSIFIQLFLSNIHPLLMVQPNISSTLFQILLFAMSFMYILGILSFNTYGIHCSEKFIRYGFLITLLCALIIFSISNNIILIMLGIYIICWALGFSIPYSTSLGMASITKQHGSAAALYTFSFASFSSFWSILQAHTGLETKYFIVFGLSASFIALCFLSGYSLKLSKK